MRLILLIVMLAFLAGGCTSSGNALMDRPATLKYKGASATPAEEELASIRAYHGTDADRDGMSRQEYRDSIIYRQIAADDDNFGQFVRNLRSEQAGANIATNLAVLTLNGIAAVTGGAQTKATLAVISGGLIGAKGSVDKELFNLEALSAIVSRMKAARLTALVPIKAGLAQSVGDYSLEHALLDLRAYANAGTLSATLTAISNDAGEEAQEATDQIRSFTYDAAHREAQPQRVAIRERIDRLTNPQAVLLVGLMQQHLGERPADRQEAISSMDPASARFRDGQVARDLLVYWLLKEGSPDEMQEWADALDIAEKG